MTNKTATSFAPSEATTEKARRQLEDTVSCVATLYPEYRKQIPKWNKKSVLWSLALALQSSELEEEETLASAAEETKEEQKMKDEKQKTVIKQTKKERFEQLKKELIQGEGLQGLFFCDRCKAPAVRVSSAPTGGTDENTETFVCTDQTCNKQMVYRH